MNTHSDLTLELECSRDNEQCGAVSDEKEDTVELSQLKEERYGS